MVQKFPNLLVVEEAGIGTWNLYLRGIPFVTEVSVPIIETIKFVFKPVFLKQFHFLKPFYIFMTLLKQAKKVTLRDANEDVDKVCIEVQKTSNNAGGKPTPGFSLHSTQNI